MNRDILFFPHDANASLNPKLQALRSTEGVAGYGRFWLLIESLRRERENGYKFKISEGYIYDSLVRTLEFENTEETEEFLTKLINKYKLIQSDGETIWSEGLLKRMQPLDAKSENGRKAANARWGNHNPMQEQCDSSADAMQVKKSKEQNIKENESTVDEVNYTKEKDIKEEESTEKESTIVGDNVWDEH